MPGKATPIGPFTRVAVAKERYIKPSNDVRRRLFGSRKAQKNENKDNVVKRVKVMSKITMRASR